MILIKYCRSIGNWRLYKTTGTNQYWLQYGGRHDLYTCTPEGQLLRYSQHATMADEQYNAADGLYFICIDEHIDVLV